MPNNTSVSIREARGVQPLVQAANTPIVVPELTEAEVKALEQPGNVVSVADAREAAAELLIREMDKVAADFAREVAYLHARIPLWAVIVGAVQRCYEDATLIAPVLPPMVRRLTDGFVPPGMSGDTNCEVCGKAFRAKRLRQRSCGGEACGLELQKRDIAKAAERQNANLAAYDAVNDTVVRGTFLRPEASPEVTPG